MGVETKKTKTKKQQNYKTGEREEDQVNISWIEKQVKKFNGTHLQGNRGDKGDIGLCDTPDRTWSELSWSAE